MNQFSCAVVSSLVASVESASVCNETVLPSSTTLDQLDPEAFGDHPLLQRRSQHVLMLSNDLCFCRLVRSYLEHSGLCVLSCTAADRADALIADRVSVDLWMIDVAALGIDGLYIAARLQECRPEAPILILEDDRPDGAVLERFFCSEWARISKRIFLPKLLATIHRLLQHGVDRKTCRAARIKTSKGNLNAA